MTFSSHTFLKPGEQIIKYYLKLLSEGRDSVVGIATRYWLDGSDLESLWERDFSHPSRPALGPTQPPVQQVAGLLRGRIAAGALTTHPYLRPRSKKEYSYNSTPSWAIMACSRMNFTFLRSCLEIAGTARQVERQLRVTLPVLSSRVRYAAIAQSHGPVNLQSVTDV